MASPRFQFPLSDYAGSPTPRKANSNHTPTPAVLASVKIRNRMTSCSARRSCRIHSGVQSIQRMLYIWKAHELLRVTNSPPNALVSGDGRKSLEACRPLPTSPCESRTEGERAYQLSIVQQVASTVSMKAAQARTKINVIPFPVFQKIHRSCCTAS
jgi:hypothetical protein